MLTDDSGADKTGAGAADGAESDSTTVGSSDIFGKRPVGVPEFRHVRSSSLRIASDPTVANRVLHPTVKSSDEFDVPPPRPLAVRPRFTQPAKMRKRVIARPVGSSVRLKCTAGGNPRPDIVWLKDDRPLTEKEVGEGRQKKWTLSLKGLTPEHSGRYTCKVSNRAGEINATYKVEVIREYPAER